METLCQILTSHFLRYPAMQVQDVYKLLYQAALGSEHAIQYEESARNWLDRELTRMGTGPEEPVFDTISPGGEIIRVHLRPYIQQWNDPQALLNAFLYTAREWRGSKDTLCTHGQVVAQLAESQRWQLQKVEIEAFFAKMEALDFPAAHHSAIFAGLYRPAYRVVAKRFLEAI